MVQKARRKTAGTGGETVTRDKRVRKTGPQRVEKTETIRKKKTVEKPGDADGYQGGGTESIPERDAKAAETSLKPWETTLAKKGKDVDRLSDKKLKPDMAAEEVELQPDGSADEAPVRRKGKLKPDQAADDVPMDPEELEAAAYVEARLANIKNRHAHVYALEKRLAEEAAHLRKALASSNGNASDAAASNITSTGRSRTSLSPNERYFEEMIFNNHDPHINGTFDDRAADQEAALSAMEEQKAAEKSDRERQRQKEHEEQRMMESRGYMGRK